MMYKVGDKVKIKSVEKHFASITTIGKIGKIIEVYEDSNEYKVSIDGEKWYYFESEIELVKENMKGEKTVKYKVGDKVRVRSDLKGNNYYGNLFFDKEMEKFVGKICIIEKCNILYDNYLLDCSTGWKFNDAMLEPIEEKNKFKKGDKVRVIRNGKCGIIGNLSDITSDYSENGILKQNYKVNYIGNNEGDFDFYSCLELKLIERYVPILDDEEKEYLKGVIKPFKRYVKYIKKEESNYRTKEFIKIIVDNKDGIEEIDFPYFEINSMYKNMEINKKYNLKELELL